MFLLVLLTFLLRRKNLAVIVFVILMSLVVGRGGGSFLVNVVGRLVQAGVFAFVLVRYGLLAAVFIWLYAATASTFSLPLSLSAWYTPYAAAVLALEGHRTLLVVAEEPGPHQDVVVAVGGGQRRGLGR